MERGGGEGGSGRGRVHESGEAVGEGTGGEAHELKQGAHDEEESPCTLSLIAIYARKHVHSQAHVWSETVC